MTLKLTENFHNALEKPRDTQSYDEGMKVKIREENLKRLLRVEDNLLTWEALNEWLIVYWNLGHSSFEIGFEIAWVGSFIFIQNIGRV